MKDYIAAIDLGTTKVVTLVGKKVDSGSYHVIAHSEMPSKGVQRGEVLNIQEVIDVVQPALNDVRQKSGINFSEVYVGIAGQHIRCLETRFDKMRHNHSEEISADEINQLEENMYKTQVEPGEEILHVIPQSYNVDNHLGILNPVGMLGTRLEANFKIFIGKKISAEHTQRCINRLGLNLKKLVLEPLASAKAVLHDEEKEVGVVMVDIGGGTTDVVVYYDNIVRHTAVIPFGGNIITEDIRQGCGILQRQAEQVKIQCGSCFSDLAPENKMITIPGICGRDPRVISFKLLANIIEARMEEIMEAVMFEVERSGYADKLAAGIVITGGGAMMKDLPQFVKFKTGMDVRIGKPIYLTGDSNLDTKRCGYSTVIGLLMRGFEYEEVPALQTASSQLLEPVVIKAESSSKWRAPRKEKEVKKESKKENPLNEMPSEKGNKGGFIGGLFDRIPDFFGPADDNV